jgi:hypothetical protein
MIHIWHGPRPSYVPPGRRRALKKNLGRRRIPYSTDEEDILCSELERKARRKVLSTRRHSSRHDRRGLSGVSPACCCGPGRGGLVGRKS